MRTWLFQLALMLSSSSSAKTSEIDRIALPIGVSVSKLSRTLTTFPPASSICLIVSLAASTVRPNR